MTTELQASVDLTHFYDMLEKHDWFNLLSDDEKRYQDGSEFYEKIMKAANQSAAHKTLFNDYERWVWSKANGGLTEIPKPQRPSVGELNQG
jgi:hypothetical protein